MRTQTRPAPTRNRILPESALLWLVVGLSAVWMVGANIDAWYHVHVGFAIESFLSPTHALLYGGVGGTALVIAAYLLESIWRGRPRSNWLPRGFPLVLLGAVLFLIGGGFDFAWHSIFGFEVDLEALLSPAHLWLVVSFMLAMVGLLQAGTRYRAGAGRRSDRFRLIDLPVVLSVAFLFRLLTWNIGYSEPLVVDYAANSPAAPDLYALEQIDRASMGAQIAGVTGIVLHSLLLVLVLVVALRHLVLPFGAISVILLTNGVFQVAINDSWRYLPAVVGAALVAEGLWGWMRTGGFGGVHAKIGYWAFGFVVPLALFGFYFGLIALFGGVAWAVHLWAGAPVIAGLYGLLASLLVIRPDFLGDWGGPKEV